MFKLAQKREIEWPVTVRIPQDGGDTVKATFTARFEVVEQKELQDLGVRGDDMWERLLVGWKGVADEDGNEIQFSEAQRARLIQIPYVRMALSTAYGEIQSGNAAARKN